MTRDEFVAKYVDRFNGKVLDALLNSRHEELLSRWTREVVNQIRRDLGEMYDELTKKPEDKPATNGVPHPKPAASPPAAYPRRA